MSLTGSRPTSSSSPTTNLTQRSFDEQAKAELLVLIQLYLDADPKYREVATRLRSDIEQHQVFLLGGT
jgi:hypothetical protein